MVDEMNMMFMGRLPPETSPCTQIPWHNKHDFHGFLGTPSASSAIHGAMVEKSPASVPPLPRNGGDGKITPARRNGFKRMQTLPTFCRLVGEWFKDS